MKIKIHKGYNVKSTDGLVEEFEPGDRVHAVYGEMPASFEVDGRLVAIETGALMLGDQPFRDPQGRPDPRLTWVTLVDMVPRGPLPKWDGALVAFGASGHLFVDAHGLYADAETGLCVGTADVVENNHGPCRALVRNDGRPALTGAEIDTVVQYWIESDGSPESLWQIVHHLHGVRSNEKNPYLEEIDAADPGLQRRPWTPPEQI